MPAPLLGHAEYAPYVRGLFEGNAFVPFGGRTREATACEEERVAVGLGAPRTPSVKKLATLAKSSIRRHRT